MNARALRERTSHALRALNKTPTALLFIDEGLDWTCDQPTLCGVPVLHAIELSCYRWGSTHSDCPLIPIGASDGYITSQDRKRFAQAWDEYKEAGK